MQENYVLNFFGAYLVKRGIIPQEVLDEALRFLKSSNKPLGRLANESRLLSHDQVKEIVEKQFSSEKTFGRIAVDLGYLEEGQLAGLLDQQSSSLVFLGQALMELGHITAKELMPALNDYWRLQKAVNAQNHDLVACAEDSDCLLKIIDAMEAAFRRFPRLPIKLGGMCQRPSDVPHDHSFLMNLEMLEGKTLNYWIGLPDKVIMTLPAIPRDNDIMETDALIVDAMWQLMDVIMRYVRTKLSAAGHMVHETRSRYIHSHQSGHDLGNFLLLRFDTPMAPCLLGYRVDCSEQAQYADNALSEKDIPA